MSNLLKILHWNGRLGRRTWFVRLLAALFLLFVPIFLLVGVFGTIGLFINEQAQENVMGLVGFFVIFWLITVGFLLQPVWFTLQTIKRLHDIGHSGYWVVPVFVIMFLPVINFALFFYLLFAKDQQDNAYGLKPESSDPYPELRDMPPVLRKNPRRG